MNKHYFSKCLKRSREKHISQSWFNSRPHEFEASKWGHTDTRRLIVWGSTRDSGDGRKHPRSTKPTRLLKQLAYVATLHCTLVKCNWSNEKSQLCKRLTCLKYNWEWVKKHKICTTNVIKCYGNMKTGRDLNSYLK